MKGKELKNNSQFVELKDGKHKLAVDFNTFEMLEEIYGDMQTAFNKYTGKVATADIKNFLCASINSEIEDELARYTPFTIGKLLDVTKIPVYLDILTTLLHNAMPSQEVKDEDDDEKK